MKIFKYPIVVNDYFELELPFGADILTVQVQDGIPYIWCLVEPRNSSEKRKFRLAGTGHPIEEDNLIYIGTLQLHHGGLVFHLFEIHQR